MRDAFWDERNLRPLLEAVDIPVYLGADWDNVPLHLPSTFGAWQALRRQPNVRMAMLPPGGFAWPWEALHVEVLAWYDHWLKGRDTGIMDGPPIRYQVPGADGLAHRRRLAACRGDAHGLRAARRRRPRARGGRAGLARIPLPAGRLRRPGQRQPAGAAVVARLGDAGPRHAPGVRRQHRTRARGDDHRPRHQLDRRPLRRAARGRGRADHRRLAPRKPPHGRRGAQRARRAGPRLPDTGRRSRRRAGHLPHSRSSRTHATCRPATACGW